MEAKWITEYLYVCSNISQKAIGSHHSWIMLFVCQCFWIEHIQYCAKVMQTPVDEIRRNSWLFDEFLTETKLRRHFREFSRHVLFWTARTFGDKFLDGVNATRNFERKFVLCGEFSGRKFVVLFILLKKIWLNLWLVTYLCNTPIKISRYDSSLRATYTVCNHGNTQYINCVDAFGIIYVLYFW